MMELASQQNTLTSQLLYVVKIGGNVVDDEEKLAAFLSQFATLKAKKILVHGGGKVATEMALQLNIPQQLVEGRRITDQDTLRIVTMVYAGWINKKIVARLQAMGANALGLSGADGNLVTAVKRKKGDIDYGYVGDVTAINASLLSFCIREGFVPVIAPITHDGKGQLLNTNADTIAQEIARACSKDYNVSLVYSFEKAGVLLDTENEHSVIRQLTPSSYDELKAAGKVNGGMIPKLDNAFSALHNGVRAVIIGRAEHFDDLVAGNAGTILRE